MIFFYNRWHHGDLMTQIMLMQKIKREYPDLEIGCCCYYNHAKLLKDMGINVIHVSQVMPTRGAISDDRFVDRIIKWNNKNKRQEPCVIFDTWLGQFNDTHDHNWNNIIEVFNRSVDNLCFSHEELKDVIGHIKLDADSEDHYISFPQSYCNFADKIETDPKTNVYFDCSGPHSGHSSIGHGNFTDKSEEYLWQNIFSKFPELNFFTTKDTGVSMKNVNDVSSNNIGELSHISNKCDYIFGRGSGPYLCTFTEENKNKKRFLINFFNPVPLANSERDVYPFPKAGLGGENIRDEHALVTELSRICDISTGKEKVLKIGL